MCEKKTLRAWEKARIEARIQVENMLLLHRCELDDSSKGDKQGKFGKCFEGRTKRIFWQMRCMVRDEENSKIHARILSKQLMLLSTEMENNVTATSFVKTLFVQQTKR